MSGVFVKGGGGGEGVMDGFLHKHGSTEIPANIQSRAVVILFRLSDLMCTMPTFSMLTLFVTACVISGNLAAGTQRNI